MELWRQYVLSLIICSLSCWIISQIVSDSMHKELMHLVSGTILAIMILYPLSGIDLKAILYDRIPNIAMSTQFIEDGKTIAADAKAEYIKASCEAYILDKAEILGAVIEAEVALDDDMIPCYAIITGDIDSVVQNQLQNILAADLGIPKENQKWI